MFSKDLYITTINPFPNTPFWDSPKLKEAENDNLNVAKKKDFKIETA